MQPIGTDLSRRLSYKNLKKKGRISFWSTFDEHHDPTGFLQRVDQFLERVRADDVRALCAFAEELVDLFDGPVVGGDDEAVIVHVQYQVLAHDGQADEADVGSATRATIVVRIVVSRKPVRLAARRRTRHEKRNSKCSNGHLKNEKNYQIFSLTLRSFCDVRVESVWTGTRSLGEWATPRRFLRRRDDGQTKRIKVADGILLSGAKVGRPVSGVGSGPERNAVAARKGGMTSESRGVGT